MFLISFFVVIKKKRGVFWLFEYLNKGLIIYNCNNMKNIFSYSMFFWLNWYLIILKIVRIFFYGVIV